MTTRLQARFRFDPDDVCPYCKAALRVYLRPQGDPWAHCTVCDFANDAIGLTALKRDCTKKKAIEHLVQAHDLRHVEPVEIEVCLAIKERYDRFAASLKERLMIDYDPYHSSTGHDVNRAQAERLFKNLDLLNYLDNTVGFYALAESRAVESWFYPRLIDPESGVIKPSTLPRRLFRGRGWDLVLVIPLQDVPGRYCGVLCIGREGNYPNDYALRLFPDYGRRTSNAGFILHPDVYRSILKRESRGHRNTIFYNNPLHLIRTLSRFRHAGFYPPLVGWIDQLETAPHVQTTDWTSFGKIGRKTFWFQRYDSRTMRAIVAQHGKVVLYDTFHPYPEIEERYVFGNTPFRPHPFALTRMEVDAVPWENYMEYRLQSRMPQDAIEELERIAPSSKDVAACVIQLPDSTLKDELRVLQSESRAPVRLQIGQYEVVEEPAGLFRRTARQTKPTLFTDVLCFLDEVVYNERGQRKTFRGRIIYESKVTEFELPVDGFEGNAILQVRMILRRTNVYDAVIRCKNRFFKRVVYAMSPMKIIEP